MTSYFTLDSSLIWLLFIAISSLRIYFFRVKVKTMDLALLSSIAFLLRQSEAKFAPSSSGFQVNSMVADCPVGLVMDTSCDFNFFV